MNGFYWVYILTNKKNSVFYIGITNDLARRIYEHKEGFVSSFSSKYRLKKLVYVESYESVNEAIDREKQLKNWHRKWKINLIKSVNPSFVDLSNEMLK